MGGSEAPRPITTCHVAAIPFPGRGHVNPMFNFCKLLAAKRPDFLITFIVTEEWLGLLGSEPKPPANIKFATIPNVLPSELVRGADHPGFVKAVTTKMGAAVERLVEGLEERASVIVYDVFVTWVKEMGSRRNIAVAAFWPMSAVMFSLFSHYHLLLQTGHLPVTNLAGQQVCLPF